MPSTLEEVGGSKEDIPKLVQMLTHVNGNNGTISGFTTLNEEDCTAIYESMLRK